MISIEEYSFGRIKVSGRVYTRDIILSSDAVLVENWWRREGHVLRLDDVKSVVEAVKPKVLVVGTGYFGVMRVEEDLAEYCKANGIKLLLNRTGEAVNVFNELVGRGEKVVGAFHLTC